MQVLEKVDADRTGAQRDELCQLARGYVERKHECQVHARRAITAASDAHLQILLLCLHVEVFVLYMSSRSCT